jgi:hypothetical protein
VQRPLAVAVGEGRSVAADDAVSSCMEAVTGVSPLGVEACEEVGRSLDREIAGLSASAREDVDAALKQLSAKCPNLVADLPEATPGVWPDRLRPARGPRLDTPTSSTSAGPQPGAHTCLRPLPGTSPARVGVRRGAGSDRRRRGPSRSGSTETAGRGASHPRPRAARRPRPSAGDSCRCEDGFCWLESPLTRRAAAQVEGSLALRAAM